jgi:hypothetical protein
LHHLDKFFREEPGMIEGFSQKGAVLQRMSPQFEDEARRKLGALAMTLGWLVWCCVAIFIIVLIFRVAGIYLGALEDAGRAI